MADQDTEKRLILVTGATGFLGRHLVTSLLQAGHQVRVLVRDAAGRDLPWADTVAVVDGDILDLMALEEAMAGVEVVIHAAALVSFWEKEYADMMQVNAEGTARVVDACLEAGDPPTLIHISSVAALGLAPAGALIDEQTERQPGDPRKGYALSKHRAELEVYRGMAEGLQAYFVNPSVILGPTHDWTQGTGKLFTIVDGGLAWYNPGASGFVGVGDVVDAVQRLLPGDRPNGDKFLLNAANLPYRDLFTMIAEALGKPAPRRRLPRLPTMLVGWLSERWAALSGRPPLVTRDSMRTGFLARRYDGSKAQRELGLSYTPLRTVVEAAARAYRDRSA